MFPKSILKGLSKAQEAKKKKHLTKMIFDQSKFFHLKRPLRYQRFQNLHSKLQFSKIPLVSKFKNTRSLFRSHVRSPILMLKTKNRTRRPNNPEQQQRCLCTTPPIEKFSINATFSFHRKFPFPAGDHFDNPHVMLMHRNSVLLRKKAGEVNKLSPLATHEIDFRPFPISPSRLSTLLAHPQPTNLVLLGQHQDPQTDNIRTYFATQVQTEENRSQTQNPEVQRTNSTLNDLLPNLDSCKDWFELREAFKRSSIVERALMSQAANLLHFHQTHQFCSNCGSKSKPDLFGHSRNCDHCQNHIFPRTDPCVIMLVHDEKKQNLLLGRQKSWVPNRYSCLAGFLEAGETIFDAVRREVFEESGIRVGSQINFVDSQNWPFPRSLMIGCFAAAVSHEITVDPHELEDAKWFSLEKVKVALENPERSHFGVPTQESLSWHLITKFVADNWRPT